MYDFDKTIEEYSKELFADLGAAILPEEKKADIYARLQEHLHRVILEMFRPILEGAEMQKIDVALEQEDYRALSKILRRHGKHAPELEQKLEAEFQYLKSVIVKEQEDGGKEPIA